MNKTKTFKIGKSCVGGIIQIKVSEGIREGLEWSATIRKEVRT